MRDDLKTLLSRRLEAYHLTDRVSFDETALDALYKVSDGEWQQNAEFYAGLAVLNVLEVGKSTISQVDIDAVDIVEAIRLMLGGKDVWNDVVRQVSRPTMLPEGVQRRRVLVGLDADMHREARKAIEDKRLPSSALTDLIEYNENPRPEVRVPFHYDPIPDEVRAVA